MKKEKFKAKYQTEIDEVIAWSDDIVSQCMGTTLTDIFKMHERMQSTHEITTNELEWILSDLPIQLIYISERLSKLQLSLEAIKLTKSHNEMLCAKRLKSQKDIKRTATEIKQLVAEEFEDDNIGISVYETSICQIEKYISLSKELIMGAKKIWQKRINVEEANPIEPPKDLPEYTSNMGGTKF